MKFDFKKVFEMLYPLWAAAVLGIYLWLVFLTRFGHG